MTDLLLSPTAGFATSALHWVDEVDGRVTCTDVVDVTHDVRSFTFELPGQAALSFLPGQYLTFRLLVGGERVERCYTISSPPTRPERLSITVKRVPGGPVSNWLHDQVRVGDVLEASGPYGQFSNTIHPSGRYLFLTAGSGITPAMSMLRALRDTGDRSSIVFVHSARTPDDIIFRHELETLAAEDAAVVSIICESDSPDELWSGARGRLTLPLLLQAAPDLLDREVFTCGPGPYMDAVRELLGQAGIDEARTHEESFVLASGASAAVIEATPTSTATTHQVEFRSSGKVVECGSSTTLLEAAVHAGITIASSCEEGMCGTCKLDLLAGEVDMQHAGGIRPREIAQGKILPCCSKPLGDVAIDA